MEIKENNVEVVVAHRREGKSNMAIEKLLEKVMEGENVLFVTDNLRIIRSFLLDNIQKKLLENKIVFIVNKSNLQINTDTGSNIIFMSKDQLKGRGFDVRSYVSYYKIWDEYRSEYSDFDFVTMTGTPRLIEKDK